VCDVCGRIEDVPSSEFEDLVSRLRDHHDFDLDVCHTALVGRCREHHRVRDEVAAVATGST
jgi:Fe2+ or Zn2+ uptake regulation protein